MLPTYEPELRVAVTVRLLRAVGAAASQISAVPGCVFVRSRSFHVRPPPETDEKLCLTLPLGPSDAMNARSRSPVFDVESAAEAMVVLGED
jgi:hypothetical protein